jgi:hypothetical protein
MNLLTTAAFRLPFFVNAAGTCIAKLTGTRSCKKGESDLDSPSSFSMESSDQLDIPLTVADFRKARILSSLALMVFCGPVILMNQLPDGVSITDAIIR